MDPPSRPAYSFTFTSRHRYNSISTLADEPDGLTCSVEVALHEFRGLTGRIDGYPSFEEAAQVVLDGFSVGLLVPAAYPEIRRFFFNPGLTAVETFIASLPDIVLITSEGAETKESQFDILYHHPATLELTSKLSVKYNHRVEVSSNTDAGVRLTKEARSLAVTNRLVAEHHRREPLQVLAKGERMAFVVFARPHGRSDHP
ncbi:hypothetical protein Ae168Ps1_0693 [Pseudonocardia sp. Ae168_Ps1]|nr:hypothetical protein Ae168Ps1_0693 [Pseudonocardia sp. Ae168_Ps1]